MINNQSRFLYWRTNANEFLGYKPGELIVTDYHTGGGFAGTPERIGLSPISSVASSQKQPLSAIFPAPGRGIEYTIGGRSFTNYAYFDERFENKDSI